MGSQLYNVCTGNILGILVRCHYRSTKNYTKGWISTRTQSLVFTFVNFIFRHDVSAGDGSHPELLILDVCGTGVFLVLVFITSSLSGLCLHPFWSSLPVHALTAVRPTPAGVVVWLVGNEEAVRVILLLDLLLAAGLAGFCLARRATVKSLIHDLLANDRNSFVDIHFVSALAMAASVDLVWSYPSRWPTVSNWTSYFHMAYISNDRI